MENLRVIDKEEFNTILFSRIEARIYAARKLPINAICEMIVTENDKDVLEVIFKRLENEKDTKEVIVACEKLSTSKELWIRKFVARIAPIEVVCEMAVNEPINTMLGTKMTEWDFYINEIIIKRLKLEKDTKEVISAYGKLSKAKSWNVRQFVAKIAPIDVVCEMAVTEEIFGVIEIILKRLEEAIGTEELKKCMNKLAKAHSSNIRNFSYKNMPIEKLTKILQDEGYSNIVKIIKEMSN